MIIKCVNGYMFFTFENIAEVELVFDMLPIPNLVPLESTPLTFIPAAQAQIKYLIAGYPINKTTTPTKSNSDVIKGFNDNRLCYSIAGDMIVPRDLITQKVNLGKNRLGKYYGAFMLQPYAMVGFNGRVSDYECCYNPDTGYYVYDYIRFEQ